MKKLYVFVENQFRTNVLKIASSSKKSLKKAIVIKYKNKDLLFQRKYGAVIEDYGDVLGWIQEVKEVV